MLANRSYSWTGRRVAVCRKRALGSRAAPSHVCAALLPARMAQHRPGRHGPSRHSAYGAATERPSCKRAQLPPPLSQGRASPARSILDALSRLHFSSEAVPQPGPEPALLHAQEDAGRLHHQHEGEEPGGGHGAAPCGAAEGSARSTAGGPRRRGAQRSPSAQPGAPHLPTTSFRVLVKTPLRTRARLAAEREQRAHVSPTRALQAARAPGAQLATFCA